VGTPRFHDGMRLVSTRLAINCAGLFVVSTLVSNRECTTGFNQPRSGIC
jgi:hypothetical protein